MADFKVVNAPFALHGADVAPRGPAPEAVAHTREVLGELGLGVVEIAQLEGEGAAGYRDGATGYAQFRKMHPMLMRSG